MKNLLFFLAIILINSYLSFAQWTQITSGTTNNLYSVKFTDISTGYAVGDNGTILKTTNGGTNWTLQNSETTHRLSSVYFINSNIGYIVGGNGIILKTIDSGNTWERQEGNTNNLLFSVYFTDANNGYAVGSLGKILSTQNGGVRWGIQTIETKRNLMSVYFTDSKTGYIVGFYGTILKTTNNGETWDRLNCDVIGDLYSVYFTNLNKGFIVKTLGQITKTNDSGNTWNTEGSCLYDNLKTIFFLDSLTGYAVGENGAIIKTTNGGYNWFPQLSGISNQLNDVYFINDSTGYIVGSNGTILKTSYKSELNTVLSLDTLCNNISNPYECAKEIEKYQLKQYSNFVKRVDKKLILKIDNGNDVILEDKGTETDVKLYSFRDFYKEINSYCVHIEYYESCAYALINKANGFKFKIPGLIKFSPDKTRFITYNYNLDIEEDSEKNGFAIYRFENNLFYLEIESYQNEWGPSKINWISNKLIEIEKTGWKDNKLGVIGKIKYQFTGATWDMIF